MVKRSLPAQNILSICTRKDSLFIIQSKQTRVIMNVTCTVQPVHHQGQEQPTLQFLVNMIRCSYNILCSDCKVHCCAGIRPIKMS